MAGRGAVPHAGPMLALEIFRSLAHLLSTDPGLVVAGTAAATGLLASLTEVPQWER